MIPTIRNRLTLCILVAAMLAAISAAAQDNSPKKTLPIVVEGQVFNANGGGIREVIVSLFDANSPPAASPIAITRTDAFGDFQLKHRPRLKGSFVVRFKKANYAAVQRSVELDSDPDELPPFLDLTLPGDLTLSGIVVDERKSMPIAKAAVYIKVGDKNWTIQTADNGTFRVQDMLPGTADISVSADGFARTHSQADTLTQRDPVRIELAPERIVDIEIVDPTGSPIDGVIIECQTVALDDYRSFESSADGTATIQGLSTDTTALLVKLTHPRFVSDQDFDRQIDLPQGQPRSHHRLVMLSAGKVTGKVVDRNTHRPLLGVRVAIGEDGDQALLRDWSAPDGTFAITAVPPGQTIAICQFTGYAPEIKSITVTTTGKTVVDFALTKASSAAGVVVDPSDKPITDAYIYTTLWRNHSLMISRALTGSDGRFVLDNLPDDPIQVSIEAAGYDPLDNQVVTPSKTDHRFVLTKAAPSQETLSKLKVGQPFPMLDLTALDGTTLKIADLKGTIILVDFWATWCGPCVAELPTLRGIHDAFGSRKDFLLISISIDDDSNAKTFKKFIKAKKMNWPQVFGKKAGAEKAANQCGVEFIPQAFIVGPNGLIRAANLTGEALTARLAELLAAESAR